MSMYTFVQEIVFLKSEILKITNAMLVQ